jgi:hypothetical protein
MALHRPGGTHDDIMTDVQTGLSLTPPSIAFSGLGVGLGMDATSWGDVIAKAMFWKCGISLISFVKRLAILILPSM